MQYREGSSPTGVHISFQSPEALRAYVLDIHTLPAQTLAERISGIREKALGQTVLDGALFGAAKVSLIVEPNRGGGQPTAIIRADLDLGNSDSQLKMFQRRKVATLPTQERKETEDDFLFDVVGNHFNGQGKDAEMGGYFQQWDSNTARIYGLLPERDLTPEAAAKTPMVLLQVWDQDTGAGSISISLLSFSRYTHFWYEREREFGGNTDEADRWRFGVNPVGIDVSDQPAFVGALRFYEKVFPRLLSALYQTENLTEPPVVYEIESPNVFQDGLKVTFDGIGGQKRQVEMLKALVEQERTNQFLGRRPFTLLAGPPGTGKTSLIKAAANELDAKLIILSTRDLPADASDADYLTLLEAGYWKAKEVAMLGGKVVLALESLDSLLGGQVRLHDRFTNMLDEWTEDSKSNVLLLATTNHPDGLLPAILNRATIVEVGYPNREDIQEIFEKNMDRFIKISGRSNLFGRIEFNRVINKLIASKPNGKVSARDIVNLLRQACRICDLEEKGQVDTETLVSLLPDMPQLGFRP